MLRTGPGGASPLGVAVDAAARPEVVGTLAGDDTLLIVCKDARTARRLAREFAQASPRRESP